MKPVKLSGSDLVIIGYPAGWIGHRTHFERFHASSPRWVAKSGVLYRGCQGLLVS